MLAVDNQKQQEGRGIDRTSNSHSLKLRFYFLSSSDKKFQTMKCIQWNG
jgi:hypothetical protein